MDIAKLFKSKTRKEIFRLYFTNPDKEYYLRELERMLDIPVSMIRKELIRLEKEGVFLSHKKGNLVYFRLNHSYPLFEELKSIVFKTVGAQGALKNALSKIEGIKTAFLYGSFAKNQENITSDIDLFLIGNVDEDKLIREINKIEKALKREINYTVYAPDEFKKKKAERDSFIADVIDNPKIMMVGDKDDL